MPYCTNCGAEEQEGQRFCPRCGSLTEQEAPVLSTAGAEAESVPLAGFWWRVLGWFIDTVILLIPLAALNRSVHNYWAARVVAAGITLLYATLLIGLRGRTIGMAATKLRCVAKTTGEVAGVSRALVRAAYVAIGGAFVTIYHPSTFRDPVTQAQKTHNVTVGAVILLLNVPLFLSYLWAAWDKQHQTLYDKVAGTVVTREVSTSATITFEPPYPRPRAEPTLSASPVERFEPPVPGSRATPEHSASPVEHGEGTPPRDDGGGKGPR